MSQTQTTRLSPRQAQIGYVGFRPVYLQHVNRQHGNYFRSVHPSLLTHRFHGYHGVFRADFMEAILGVYRKTALGHKAGCRLPLTYIEVSALLLAARAASKLIRHGHLDTWAPRLDRSIHQLIRKLEAEQKRLKREHIAIHGKTSFEELSRSWQSFARWLRIHYLTCDCDSRRPNPAYRFRQRGLDHFCKLADSELSDRGIQVPPPGLLRKLIRQAVSNSRHREKHQTIYHLKLNDSFAALHLADYVESHINKNIHKEN
jgi:hypothetical protein